MIEQKRLRSCGGSVAYDDFQQQRRNRKKIEKIFLAKWGRMEVRQTAKMVQKKTNYLQVVKGNRGKLMLFLNAM